MHRLPREMFAHIGAFMSVHDRRTCLETSKTFCNVSDTYTYHILDMTNDNIIDRLHRLPLTLEYILQVKPKLEKYELRLNNISIRTTASTLALPRTHIPMCISLNDCNFLAVKSLLDAAYDKDHGNTDINITLKQLDIYGIYEWYDSASHIRPSSLYTYLNDIMVGPKHAISHPMVVHAQELIFDAFVLSMPLDLTEIDINVNKKLAVCMHNDVPIVDAYKVTHLMISVLDCVQRIVSSFTSERHQLRLEAIFVYTEVVMMSLLGLAKFVPKTTQFKILVRSPRAIGFIHALKQIGIQEISYIGHDRISYLVALFCTRVFRDMYIGIHDTRDVLDADIKSNMSVDDIYNLLPPVEQQTWFAMYHMFNKQQQGDFI